MFFYVKTDHNAQQQGTDKLLEHSLFRLGAGHLQFSLLPRPTVSIASCHLTPPTALPGRLTWRLLQAHRYSRPPNRPWAARWGRPRPGSLVENDWCHHPPGPSESPASPAASSWTCVGPCHLCLGLALTLPDTLSRSGSGRPWVLLGASFPLGFLSQALNQAKDRHCLKHWPRLSTVAGPEESAEQII